MDPASLIDLIRTSVIGDDEAVAGPFGVRRVTYADYTASGRSLTFIEDYLRDAVLPLYANTHTESSGTGLQTTRFREEARQIILRRVRRRTRARRRLLRLGLDGRRQQARGRPRAAHPGGTRRPLRAAAVRIPAEERPVVFIGPYEHHSNELPWRESIADVVVIPEDHDGRIDLARLETELLAHADRPLKIGSFSAASNVTGIISDTRAISILLHRHGALSFWDFAAAAPYVEVEMSPHRPGPDAELDYKDAIFISPHKFIGGPGTPGLLIARRELFRNRVPSMPGGGTVAYVNPLEHRYLTEIEHREEGGTPAIVESIRAGLVFQLKKRVGVDAIRQREEAFIGRAIARWRANPAIEILGNPALDRLSIVSFVVRHQGRYLHHNFVVALLNDLFGIQSRGGCSCAGPYGHRLLGIDLDTSHEFEREIARGCEGIKPGWIRVNFNYFISETVFALHPRRRRPRGQPRLAAAAAVPLRARQRPLAARRRPRRATPQPGRHRLRRAAACTTPRIATGSPSHAWPTTSTRHGRSWPRSLARSTRRRPAVSADFEALRWFWMPAEVAATPGVGG